MPDLSKLREAIVKGDVKTAVEVTKEAIAAKVDPQELLDKYMIPAMDEVGQKFECNELFVPELLLTARVMKSALELVRPLLAASGAEPAGRVVIGTVKGDLHDIGKNLVAIMLKGAGFEIVDLGNDVPAAKFVDAAEQEGATVIGLSALLTTTMPVMKQVVEIVRERQLSDKVKVVIGGAPVSQDYADQIGADAYAFDGINAVEKVKTLLGKN